MESNDLKEKTERPKFAFLQNDGLMLEFSLTPGLALVKSAELTYFSQKKRISKRNQ